MSIAVVGEDNGDGENGNDDNGAGDDGENDLNDDEDDNGADDENGENGNGESGENGADDDVDDVDDENGNDESGENGADDDDNEVGDDNGAEEENDTVSEDKETMPFKTNHGSYVRLLQLEKSIHRNILFGEIILDRENIEDDDELKELEEILEAMRNLQKDVSEYELVDREEDVRAFVEFKHDAINLTKQFRDKIRTFVQESEQNALRGQINREIRAQGELNKYNNALRERARQHNEEVIASTAENMGVRAQEVVERFRNEELDHREIKKEMLDLAKQARAQGDKDFVAELREAALREKIRARNEATIIREELKNEHIERVQNRIQEVRENLGDEIAQRVNARINPGNGRANGNGNGRN